MPHFIPTRRIAFATLCLTLHACAGGDPSRTSETANPETQTAQPQPQPQPQPVSSSAAPTNPNGTATNPNSTARANNPNWAILNTGLPEQPSTSVSGNGAVSLNVDASNSVVAFGTTLLVPPEPPHKGTLFLWPGLQPGNGSINYNPVNNGVLQPVLTWGPSCAPSQQQGDSNYGTWWVSAQYVNTFTSDSTYSGCFGGQTMQVAPGDGLQMRFTLNGETWQQVVTDLTTGESVSFDMNLLGQGQNLVEFIIEAYSGAAPTTDVVFVNNSFTLAVPGASTVKLTNRGQRDFASEMTISSDNRTFTIPRIVLRAQNVASTYPN